MKQTILLFAVVALVGCKSAKYTMDDHFVNTLGMSFVPISETKVQFSIWETRVKDYAAYVAANPDVNARWKNHKFEQAETHPVVMVGYDDAQAFCAWLTKKELAAGKLKQGQRYRLPTDAEWSVAVGLGEENGDTPKEKDGGIKDVYPWGKGYPPPKGSGNYRHDHKKSTTFIIPRPRGVLTRTSLVSMTWEGMFWNGAGTGMTRR